MIQRLCHCGSQSKVGCPNCGAPLCYGMNCYRTHEEKCRPLPITADPLKLKAEEMRPHGGVMRKP